MDYPAPAAHASAEPAYTAYPPPINQSISHSYRSRSRSPYRSSYRPIDRSLPPRRRRSYSRSISRSRSRSPVYRRRRSRSRERYDRSTDRYRDDRLIGRSDDRYFDRPHDRYRDRYDHHRHGSPPRSGRPEHRDDYPRRAPRPAVDRPETPPSNVLGLFGLSYATTEEEIRTLFGNNPDIEKIFVVMDRTTGQGKGLAFVNFGTTEQAVAAKAALGESPVLNNRNIRIDFSKTLKPHDPTPGQYMGRADQRSVNGRSHGRDRPPAY